MPGLLLPLRAKKVTGEKMRSSTVDVLIIGAGPAGLSAAIELKNQVSKRLELLNESSRQVEFLATPTIQVMA